MCFLFSLAKPGLLFLVSLPLLLDNGRLPDLLPAFWSFLEFFTSLILCWDKDTASS